MKANWILAALLASQAGAALAADSPWTGTWNLDEARSHLTGQTMTISKGAGGLLHYADGSTSSFDFGLDGKEYPSWANRTVTWTQAGESAWDSVNKADGKVLTRVHYVVSDQGKTLTATATGTRADGKPFHEEDVFSRVSGTDGLIGTWRVTKVHGGGGPQQFVISVPAPGVMHYEVTDMKASAEGRTDGSDNPLTGANLPPAATISFQALAPNKIRYVMKLNGKVDNMGEQTLAADGRTFTDVNWIPGKDDEKTSQVYVKQ
jgi:hypothetical protein